MGGWRGEREEGEGKGRTESFSSSSKEASLTSSTLTIWEIKTGELLLEIER